MLAETLGACNVGCLPLGLWLDKKTQIQTSKLSFGGRRRKVGEFCWLGICAGDAAMNASSIDMDMMEAEPSSAVAAPAVQDDVAKDLLATARRFVDQGNPSQALQAVVMAMRTKGGEGAVVQILQRARELYRNKLQATSEADQLASLFAECAIAEAQPERDEPYNVPDQAPKPDTFSASPMDSDAYKTSILAETGRRQIMLDAFSDGSSFICLQCGGLVSMSRKDEHYAYWCQ